MSSIITCACCGTKINRVDAIRIPRRWKLWRRTHGRVCPGCYPTVAAGFAPKWVRDEMERLTTVQEVPHDR